MKKLFLSFLFTFSLTISFSQNVGIGTNTPHQSAALDITSTNGGLLPPRMSTTERNAIANPAVGLQIFNTTSNCLQMFVLGRWQNVFCGVVDSTTIVDTTLLTDIDGNKYPTVKICDQIWMAKNLDVAHYRNGDIIPQVTDPTEWANLTTGAWCWYNNESSNGAVYGRLYNWYAVNDPRGLAPEGWHVPSDGEWDTLVNCLGGANIAGGKMKTTGTALWNIPNSGATNSSGFNALPGGYHNPPGEPLIFDNIRNYGVWWSRTESLLRAHGYYVNNFSESLTYVDNLGKREGFSVRCIKDTPINTLNDGLVAYYPFTGNAGDSSGNGNHGTVNGATLTTDRFGNSNKAYSFNNNLITVPHQSYLGFTYNSQFSVSIWAYKTDNQSTIHFIGKRPYGASEFNWQMGMNLGANVGLSFTGSNGNGENSPGIACPLNTWINLVGTYDNGYWKLYLNGNNIGSKTSSLFFDDVNTPLTIGNSGGFEPFYGSLDDIRIYNRALNQAEITYLATH